MHRSKTFSWALSLLSLAGILGASARSDACGAAISWGIGEGRIRRPNVDAPAVPPSRLLSNAEKSLDRGEAVSGALAVIRAVPDVRSQSVARAAPNELRAMRDIAVAVVRSAGATGPDGVSAWAGTTKRAENLGWAERTLRELARKDPSDTVLATDLGEALIAKGETEDEGREILEALANDDLIATAYGYESLAKERGATGDADGMKSALERCKAMSIDDRICHAELSGAVGS